MNTKSEPVQSGVPLAKVVRGLLVFYLIALALNAASLHRNNEHLPYGPIRSFWITVSAPIARVAVILHLDRPREWVADTVGKALNQ